MSWTKDFQVAALAALLGLIFCSVSGFAVLAEGAEEIVEEVVEEEVAVEETLGPEEMMGPTVEITPTGLISFVFTDAPIREVLRLFADKVNINIVATPTVTGTVNMKLDNVKWRTALELILEVNKLKMIEDKENNIIKVMTQAEVAAEPLTTKIYALNYLQAADYGVVVEGKEKTMPGAATMLTPLLAENETIQADAASNKLIVNAIPATHDMLDTVILELDKQIRQVHIEVRFIEASTDASSNIGIKWEFLKEYGVEATDLSASYLRGLDKTYSSATGVADVGKSAERIYGSEDRSRSSASSTLLGPSRESTADFLSTFSRDITRDQMETTSWDRLRGEVENTIKTATLSADNVRLVLSALMEDSDAKLISNPKIATVDNKLATIKAAKQWPIPRYNFNADTGSWEVQGFDYKDIGITLKVTPHINQDNYVTLDVDPEVSNQVGVAIFGGGASGTAEIPIIDVRNANTRVIVKSGETLVIGGLVRTDEILAKSGIPLLKEIPLLGNLFKHTSKSILNLDLMVFITPTIVEGPGAAVLAPPSQPADVTATDVAPETTVISSTTE